MKQFEEAVSIVPESLRRCLLGIGEEMKKSVCEIRLRANRPVVLVSGNESFVLNNNSSLGKEPGNAAVCTAGQLEETFACLCGYSVQSCQNDIANGFVTMPGGHRVGITGTAVSNDGKNVASLRNVCSLNIRVAREICGSSDEIYNRVFKNKSISGLLIAGPPASGKTTVLRDLVRRLSGFEGGKGLKVCVIDERGELAAMNNGVCLNDIGVNSDVLTSYPKNCAITSAVRTMSPQIVACDEISTDDEIRAIAGGANSGVVFIATVHAASFSELIQRRQIELLLDIGCFRNVVLLSGKGKPCTVENIYEVGELKDEIYRRRFGVVGADCFGYDCG